MEKKGLREIRMSKSSKAKRYTVAEAAAVLGVSMPTYRKLERDPKRATIEQAEKLAKYFGCDVEDVFYLSGDSN